MNGAAMTGISSTKSAPPRQASSSMRADIDRTRLASIGLRCSAFLLDYILTILIPAITVLIAVYCKRRLGAPGLASAILIIGYLATAALLIFNAIYLCERDGQSFGKRFIGIRIICSDGSKVTYKTALLRHFIGYPISIFFGGLGIWWALWDGQQQGWHDKLAGTLVVKD
jgi:uncharacterized RDD family membrane protein YckC